MTEESGGGGEPTDLTLENVLTAAAEDLPDLTAAPSADGSMTWTRRGAAFAVLTGSVAEFRLDPLVVRAALRTPDTGLSTRGSDWIAFGPAALDEGSVDRAEAWFLSAYRRAVAGR